MIGRNGSGKSWSIARYIAEEWIPNHAGRVFTNVPLKVDAIADYCLKRYKIPREQTIDRIRVIPWEVEEKWAEASECPQEYFEDLYNEWLAAAGVDPSDYETTGELQDAAEALDVFHPLEMSLVILDEAYNYWPNDKDKDEGKKLQANRVNQWLSTIRHEGARLIFVCQNDMQLSAGLRRYVASEIFLTSLGDWPLPFIGMPVDDLLQIIAKITGVHLKWVRESVEIADGKELAQVAPARTWFLDARIFNLYESRHKRGGGRGKEEPPAWKRLPWPKFLKWWIGRNWLGVSKAALVLLAVLVLIYPGGYLFKGFAWLRSSATDFIMEANGKKRGKSANAKAKPEADETAVELTPKVTELLAVVDDLTRERDRLRAALDRGAELVLIDAEFIQTADGRRYGKGATIRDGQHEGKKISSFSAALRSARLDDGTELRLSPRQPLEPARSPELSRPLSGGSGGSWDDSGWRSAKRIGQDPL
ncbi:MAG: hypothetical protein NXI22_21835 [bacterium]|nr:hypothetical protein [bacterium]